MASNIETTNRISKFRRLLPQIIACFAKNVTLMNFAIAINFSTILIPALTGLNPINNPNEETNITRDDASFIAGLIPLSVIVGASMTNLLDPLGRKKSLILCNVPFLIGWICLSQSYSFTSICISMGLLGFSSGFIESPIYSFIGEVAEPDIRTILSSTTSLTNELSSVMIFFMSNNMPWRDVSLICAGIPIMAALIMLIVPETPQWLLSRNRPNDARKALQWFRGWTEPKNVQIEFENLQRYKENAYACYDCEKKSISCTHPPPNLVERLRDFCRRKTIIPFFILICLMSMALFCGLLFRPYMVPTLTSFKSPIDPNTVLVWSGYVGLIANVLSIIAMRAFGKRNVYLISLSLSILTIFGLGIYGLYFLNSDIPHLNKFPIFVALFSSFLFNFGLRNLVNLLMSEIFSYRTKGLAAGLSFSVGGIIFFTGNKTFYALQEAITLPGQCILYASLALLGFIVNYLMLPETEGRTLEDIEIYFSDKKRSFFDIHIKKQYDQKYGTTHEKCSDGVNCKLMGDCHTIHQEP